MGVSKIQDMNMFITKRWNFYILRTSSSTAENIALTPTIIIVSIKIRDIFKKSRIIKETQTIIHTIQKMNS